MINEVNKLVKILKTKIVERGYTTPNGGYSDRPNKGKNELTIVWVVPCDLSILTKHGYNIGYNGKMEFEKARCYYRNTELQPSSKWGNRLQIFINPSWNGCLVIRRTD